MARRSRIPAPHGPDEESYFVSLNDLLIGMLFVFIILLMIFALNYQSAEMRFNKRIDALEDELSGRQSQRLALLKRIQKGLADIDVIANLDEKNGVLSLPEATLFESGSADIGPQGQVALAKLAQMLTRELPCFGALNGRGSLSCPANSEPILEAVYVEGHTDVFPINTIAYRSNWELSSARAIRTYRLMVEISKPLESIRNASGNATLFGVSAYADQRPIADNRTPEGRRKNRRIDIRFLIAPPTRGDIKAATAIGDFLGATK